jgi:hypothetical protein
MSVNSASVGNGRALGDGWVVDLDPSILRAVRLSQYWSVEISKPYNMSHLEHVVWKPSCWNFP